MSEPNARAPALERRLSTGTAELDRMLDGGLMPHRPYLLVGPSGTGKTTLALEFLCDGVRNGERALFVTVEEPPNEVLWNHRALLPDLGRVEVFDAIPDVMRFERTPFKDIAAVRSAVPFNQVDLSIRKTPELTSVEVTISALEQMLRTEVQRKTYSRVAVDSLTALQYFCMKGYEPAAGAQSFLRFLSDLRVTTILTVESPLEDVETPERMLARGEIRLFRWEVEGVTVRAVGVEKFRGSSHDVRLHPYRIGSHGLDVNLLATISRDTQVVVAAAPADLVTTGEPPLREPSTVELIDQEVRDLLLVGEDVAAVRLEVEAALASARLGEATDTANHLSRALAAGAVPPEPGHVAHHTLPAPAEAALARILARAESTRTGVPPARLPEPPILAAQLARLLNDIARGTRDLAGRVPYPASPPPVLVVTEPLPAALLPTAAAAPVPLPAPPPPTPFSPVPVASAPPVPALLPSVPPVPLTTPSTAPVAPAGGAAETPPTVTARPEAPRPRAPARVAPAPPPTPRAPAEVPRPVPGTPSPPDVGSPRASRTSPPPLPLPSLAPLDTPASVSRPPDVARGAGPARPPRPAPPPLPAGAPHPRAYVTAPVPPLPPPPAHPGPDAPAVEVPAPSSAPESSAPGVVSAIPAETAPAPVRRRKRPSALRKKAESLPLSSSEPSTASVPEAAPSPVASGTGPSPPSLEAEPPKPKRRLVRKKKAPTVVGALAGPVPAGAYGSETPTAPPPEGPPPGEGT